MPVWFWEHTGSNPNLSVIKALSCSGLFLFPILPKTPDPRSREICHPVNTSSEMMYSASVQSPGPRRGRRATTGLSFIAENNLRVLRNNSDVTL